MASRGSSLEAVEVTALRAVVLRTRRMSDRRLFLFTLERISASRNNHRRRQPNRRW